MYGDPISTGPTVEQLKQAYPDVADYVLHKLPDLYTRCAAHFGPALDVAEIIRLYTQASRVRFAGGGGAAGRFDADELDAIVHAAEHGYEMCLKRLGHNYYCWLPWGHEGECVKDNFFLWKLLFGQPVSGVAVIGGHRERAEPTPENQYRLRDLGECALPSTIGAISPPADQDIDVRETIVGAADAAQAHRGAGGTAGSLSDHERVVLCMERHEVEVLEKPDGLRVEVIPWGRLAEDPETDPGAMDLLNDALDAGDLDRALNVVHALTDEPYDGPDEDPSAWLGPCC